MGLFSRLAGTMATFFQIGGPNAPGINQNAAALEVRNSTNSAFAITRGATPIGVNDYVTKAYADALVGGGGVQAIDFAIGTAATTDSVTAIPANAIVLRAMVTITTPYTPGTSIEVGQVGNLTLLQAIADNAPGTANNYDAPQRTPWGAAPLVVVATIGGAPATGAGFVTVEYTLPNP